MKPKTVCAELRFALASLAFALALVGGAQATNQYKVLHYFAAKPSETPQAQLVADSAGNLYGTTAKSRLDGCGSNGCGTIFKLTRGSDGSWAYSVIYRFHGSDGESPQGGLIFDPAGNLYGTTYSGGTYGYGTVFELSPSAGRKWRENTLYSFGQLPDVENPVGALLFDASGNLYGAGTHGGTSSAFGGIFELRPSGNRWNETTLYRFAGAEGANPIGNLIWDSAGNLYGTTYSGGTIGWGAVFELSPTPREDWMEAVLYSFTGGEDGARPNGVISDSAGNLYGVAQLEGSPTCQCGTVFELTRSMGNWSFNVLHTFDGADGSNPVGSLVFDAAGALYGTTAVGGDGDCFTQVVGCGVVFKLSASGNNWTETLLHSFHLKHGESPFVGLTFYQGVLYGITDYGGIGSYEANYSTGYGVVFSVVP